jgi:excisionase family DNA binding protein
MDARFLTLKEVAAQLGWTRSTLTRALQRHEIPTIGIGRRARIEAGELEILIAKERELCRTSYSRQAPAKATGPGSSGFTSTDSDMRSYWRRRLGQQQRKKSTGSSSRSKVLPLGRS